MSIDFNTAPEQRSHELIPDKTICSVQMKIRPGNAGDEGLLKRSKNGECEMLDCEFTVVDGPHAKRKFWTSFVLHGLSDGHAKAAEISQAKLRAMLESARGVKPSDTSEAARKARVAELSDFDGMRFIAKVGIEKGAPKGNGGGDWPDKNYLLEVITPEKKDWHGVEQPQPLVTKGVTGPGGIKKPEWAQS
jgi:hypothetical protein